MGNAHILVADDDPLLLDDVAATLAALGDVTCATTGDELMQRLANDPPYDLVVTDIAMPWMTGLQAMQSTRYAGLATPVVVMTALRDPSLPERVRALGGRAVLLHKPFGIHELFSAVEMVWPRLASERTA